MARLPFHLCPRPAPSGGKEGYVECTMKVGSVLPAGQEASFEHLARRVRSQPSGVNRFDFLGPAMEEHGYQIPDSDDVTGRDGLHSRTPEWQARQARESNAP